MSAREGGKEQHVENKPRENVIPLDPITTNLSYPSDSWIRIEVSLLFGGAPDQALADQIHQDVLSYLRTVSLQQIEGPRGFQYLRDDLRERVKLRSEGRVNDILFRTFVIE
jgi:flagellar FliL protein